MSQSEEAGGKGKNRPKGLLPGEIRESARVLRYLRSKKEDQGPLLLEKGGDVGL